MIYRVIGCADFGACFYYHSFWGGPNMFLHNPPSVWDPARIYVKVRSRYTDRADAATKKNIYDSSCQALFLQDTTDTLHIGQT